MKFSFAEEKWFYVPYICLLLCGAICTIIFTKAGIHLWLNQYHSHFFDFFFRNLTYLGDGIFLPIFLLIMLFIRYRFALLLIIVFLVSGLFVQILKRLVFEDMGRPLKYLGESAHLYLVPGVQQFCCNSFPSGHSATAFGIFLCFALITKKNAYKFILLLFACLVAYSRVYLSQHFLIDIMAGSLIGVISATFCYKWIYVLKHPWLNNCLKLQSHKKS